MSRDGSKWILLGAALLGLASAGCSCTTNLGTTSSDAGRDAASPPVGAYDECGNGIDDDDDGAIDEDCPCSTDEVQPCWDGLRTERAVGECADGQQRCSATGSNEFGRWLECTSTRGPATERCEGSRDEDCDGAIDEGCTPCEEGATRVCGVEFIEPPCTSGAQTCRDGTWGACEGAIGPSAEVCEDGVDNDCDGEVDDVSFCMCSPVPEICGNGVDDDCDGAADEPPCGSISDAGVPDAGSCTPRTCGATECGMHEDGCGGLLDCGACTESCSPTLTRIASLPGAHLERLVRSGGVIYGRFDAVGGGTTLRTLDPTDWSTSVIHDVGAYLSPHGFAVADGRLCFASPSGGVRCGPVSGPYDALPLPAGVTSSAASAVAIHGEDVYWLASTTETPRARTVLLRTTAGVTTELFRSDALADGATVIAARHPLLADASGVTVVLGGVHFVHYTHSSGGEAGATGVFSTDGTHEQVVHLSREGAPTPRWSSGPLTPIPAPGPRSATHWDWVLGGNGGARDGSQLFWAEAADGWGVTSELPADPAASPENPLRLRTRTIGGSEGVSTLMDDASTTRRSVFWVHPTARHVYLMTYVYAGTEVRESRLERVPRAGGPLEAVASFATTTPLRALSSVAQIGDCLLVGIRRGNFDSELHTIRVE